MSMHAEVRSVAPRAYRELSSRHGRQDVPRAGYVLAVSGVLAAVTFTLIYLTTLSYAGF